MSAVDNVSMGASEPLRERLVGAGVDMLEEVGAAQLGLRAITRAAGVSHGAPRRHFPTHRALLAAIAARGFADLIERFAQAAAGTTTPREQLQVMAAEYVEFAGERPEMFTLMFRHDLLEGSGAELRSTSLPLFGSLVALVEEATAGSADARERALGIWTGLHGMAVLAADRALQVIGDPQGAGALVGRTVDAHLAHG